MIPSDDLGGAERYAQRIALAARDQWDVTVALRAEPALAPLWAELFDADLRLLRLVRGRRLRGFVGFSVILALHRPRVVHLTLPWPVHGMDVRLACAVAGVPVVAVHALVPPADDLEVKHRWLYAWTESRRQSWVAVSDFGRRSLAAAFGVPQERVAVIRNAPRPRATSAPEVRHGPESGEQVTLPAHDGLVIASVGRLSHEKGHDVLIDAAATLVARFPGLLVVIAGEGPARAALEAQIQQLGLGRHVYLLGQVADIPALLATTDVFAFPSRMEGTPAALLEAMLHGVPTVAAEFEGADEVITAGHTGLLVPRDDADALAGAIERLLQSPGDARAMAERGRTAAGEFDEPTLLRETLTALDLAGGVSTSTTRRAGAQAARAATQPE